MSAAPRTARRAGLRTVLAVAIGVGGLTACGQPKNENRVVYGLEAENSGGWCLAEGQLAISGMQIAKAIYDPLTMPNEKGEFEPWLAKTITHNATYDKWTITLRDGVKFHDGTDLTAEVVKNNIDAYRGQYPARSSLLFVFVLANVDTVTVTGDLTLDVTTKTPWPAFPAYLNANNRFGVMSQSQLDDEDTCDRKLVGTGPFMLEDWEKDWVPDDHLTVKKNPNYWLEGYPKLDEIEFTPIPDTSVRENAVLSGEVDMIHTSDMMTIDNFQNLAKRGLANIYATDDYAEVTYVLLNNSKPPFNNICARKALAYASDRDLINKITNAGLGTVATGPFAPGSIGYLDAEESGFPQFDSAKAEEFLAKYVEGDPSCEVQCPPDAPDTPVNEEAECKKESNSKKDKFEFSLTLTADPSVQAVGKLIQALGAEYGVKINLDPIDQANLVNRAISGDFQATVFRNHPGGEPDGQYVWFSNSPTNFSRFQDQELLDLLNEGRATADRDEQQRIYGAVTKRFAEQVYNIWAWYTRWGIVTTSDVGGVIQGPDMPSGEGPFPGLATGHSLLDLCVEGVSCDE